MSFELPLRASAGGFTARRLALLTALGVGFVLAADFAAAWQEPVTPPKPARPSPQEFQDTVLPLLKQHCFACHGSGKQAGGLALHQFADVGSVTRQRSVWEGVLEMLQSEVMPPEDRPALPPEDRKKLVRWIEGTLFFVDCDLERDPGRVTVRRLNRAEYNNTVRDLLGTNLRPADQFPSDEVGEGFDNNGDVLSLPPLLLEKYLDAAEQLAEAALPAADTPRQGLSKRGSKLKLTGGGNHLGDHVLLHSTGDVAAAFELPRAGKYVVRVAAAGQQAGDETAKMRVEIRQKDQPPEKLETFEVEAALGDPKGYEVEASLPKKLEISAAFINDYYNPAAADPKQRDRNLAIYRIEVLGPLGEPPPSPFPVVRPSDQVPLAKAAAATLEPLMRRAFRRPIEPSEVEPYVQLASLAVQRGESYEQGLRVAVAGVLVSPHFLFRIESDPLPDNPQGAHFLSHHELAVRLSYFLWSSMPDKALFDLAEQGKLHDTVVLRAQVARMLKDPRARALAENFAAQWLNLRNLELITPDPQQFPEFSPELRADMREETLEFFAQLVANDGNLFELLNGNYSFLNERLANLYGVAGVEGAQLRRVDWPAGVQRAGVLTHASTLTLTSNPTRTSPVKRGKWIMENILGTPPPEPPADVPELAATQRAAPNATLRQQLEIHRQNPNCAVCHVKMDALGFGLENFDAIGRWREREGQTPIDATGTLPSGEAFGRPLELIEILAKRREAFRRTLAEKLLTYALGRGLKYYDRCAIDSMIQQVAQQDDRFSALVNEIVLSEPFRRRRGDGGTP